MSATTTEIVVPRGAHSPLGPSSSKRWINCPGSVDASKDAKDDESPYAAEGTAAHYLSELARKEGKKCVHWLGWTLVVGAYKFKVDEGMIGSAQAFVDWCEEQPGVPLTEQRIGFSRYFAPQVIEKYGEAFGTLDDARLNDEDVHIIDFKHGQGVQEFAKENPQLRMQALGVLEDFGYLYDIKGFWYKIAQPRLNHFDSWYETTEDLLKWAENLKVYSANVAEGKLFKAGAWCRFCKIRKTCAVRSNSNLQTLLAECDFEDLDKIEPRDLEVQVLRAVSGAQHMTPEQIAKILPNIPMMKAWLADIEKHAIYLRIQGQDVGGWKLVEGRSNRKILDEATWVSKLKSLEINPYKPPEVISVAQAEAALGKKEFKQRFKEDEDWTKPPGKPKLVAPDDKRPEMTNPALTDFVDLDSED